MKAYLFREQRPDCMIGGLSIEGGFQCYILELPWRENEHDISCIPEGVYQLGLRPSAKFGNWTNGMIYHLNGVPGRTDILIHAGNTVKDTHGCLIIGDSVSDDLPTFIRNSRKTLIALHQFTEGKPWTLTISSK